MLSKNVYGFSDTNFAQFMMLSQLPFSKTCNSRLKNSSDVLPLPKKMHICFTEDCKLPRGESV